MTDQQEREWQTRNRCRDCDGPAEWWIYAHNGERTCEPCDQRRDEGFADWYGSLAPEGRAEYARDARWGG